MENRPTQGRLSRTLLIAYWHTLLENLQTSSLDFYAAAEAALQRRNMADASPSRVDWREAGLASAKREYLRVTRGTQTIDICAAPFGSGFFVSWWFGESRPSPLLPTIAFVVAVIIAIKLFGVFFGVTALVLGFFGVGALISQGEASWHPYAFAVPLLGTLWERLFRPVTLYRYDTMLMFKSAVHRAVLEVIDGLTDAQGLRRLSEDERKPILRDFWRR